MKTSLILLFSLFINGLIAQINSVERFITAPLKGKINSTAHETHPMPFGDDILYYSSFQNEEVKVLRSEKIDDVWKNGYVSSVFSNIKSDFTGGSFIPSKKRFYFSICDTIKGKYQCAIYFISRKSSSWSSPIRLSPIINAENSSNSDPYVVVKDNQEILYWVSDRAGGEGGKDIWCATKSDDANTVTFKTPINLGQAVNTPKDEISPFYDYVSNTLYFSSDGHSDKIGGFDIYQVSGNLSDWKERKLLPKPLNSKADDAYFVINEKLDGFLSSNRTHPNKIANSNDFDLLYFSPYILRFFIKGNITNEKTGEAIDNSMITLYEVTDMGRYAIDSKVLFSHDYKFEVEPDKIYELEIEKDGFEVGSFRFYTKGLGFFEESTLHLSLLPASTKLEKTKKKTQTTEKIVPNK